MQDPFWRSEYLILILTPIGLQKRQTLAQDRQFQTKMLKHESPNTSESTKPIDLKIKHNVRT